ncbi:Magnesium transporter MRS2-F [Rhynchospora pubera]|uniref:Magnesium transporter n=1 Tax=Rhynchospora pubera TaxID=906938 RepID=A0AAV8CQJ1_9POAL|nr:Magnesium transporter MRS2-F [Rhynchospora pubera]
MLYFGYVVGYSGLIPSQTKSLDFYPLKKFFIFLLYPNTVGAARMIAFLVPTGRRSRKRLLFWAKWWLLSTPGPRKFLSPSKLLSPDNVFNAQGGQRSTNDVPRGGTTKALPFEFKALELFLELASKHLDIETLALEKEAYPALDELTHNVNTLNLEQVRQIKGRLVGISSRVQKIRDELEHLLDDDMNMAFMHLSEKLMYQASVGQSSRFDFYKQPPQSGEESDGDHEEEDALQEEKDDENENETVIGFRPNLDELEMLLEAYFVQSEGILNKLATLREYVDDTEDYINIMLDDKQNQLLQMGIMLSTATMILSLGITIVGLLGMNIHIPLFDVSPSLSFWEATGGVIGGSLGLYIIILAYYRKRKLL